MDRSEPLLYDPMFASPPDTAVHDTPGRGFFGRAAVKKAAFILVLLVFVGGAIAVSFSSLSQDRLEYTAAEDGCMLSAFRADKTDAVLCVDIAGEEAGDLAGMPITQVRKFAVCGNETTAFILLGKSVTVLPNTAFYDCSALAAVLVDPANPHFADLDGVLYRKENGRLTEVMLYPRKNALYRAMLSLGESRPADAAQAAALAEKLRKWEQEESVWENIGAWDHAAMKNLTGDGKEAALAKALCYQIPEGVARVGEMAFAETPGLYEVAIPESVTEIAQMAFFKCASLYAAPLPEHLQTLGPDAFSYCTKLSYIFIPAGVTGIGHHAFYGCTGAQCVYMACAEADAPPAGQDWVPKYRKLFLHDVPVVYGAERGQT